MRKLLVLTLAACTLALFTAVPSSANFVAGECNANQVQKSLGQGDDYWVGNNNPNCVEGEGGSDTIYGEGDVDNLYGRAQADVLHGGAAADFISGGDDGDWIYGDSGNDILVGGPGDDIIYDGTGGLGDAIDGQGGYDTLKHCTGTGSDGGLDSWVNIDNVDNGPQYC